MNKKNRACPGFLMPIRKIKSYKTTKVQKSNKLD